MRERKRRPRQDGLLASLDRGLGRLVTTLSEKIARAIESPRRAGRDGAVWTMFIALVGVIIMTPFPEGPEKSGIRLCVGAITILAMLGVIVDQVLEILEGIVAWWCRLTSQCD